MTASDEGNSPGEVASMLLEKLKAEDLFVGQRRWSGLGWEVWAFCCNVGFEGVGFPFHVLARLDTIRRIGKQVLQRLPR